MTVKFRKNPNSKLNSLTTRASTENCANNFIHLARLRDVARRRAVAQRGPRVNRAREPLPRHAAHIVLDHDDLARDAHRFAQNRIRITRMMQDETENRVIETIVRKGSARLSQTVSGKSLWLYDATSTIVTRALNCRAISCASNPLPAPMSMMRLCGLMAEAKEATRVFARARSISSPNDNRFSQTHKQNIVFFY